MVPKRIFLESRSHVHRVFCGTEKALNQSRKKEGEKAGSVCSLVSQLIIQYYVWRAYCAPGPVLDTGHIGVIIHQKHTNKCKMAAPPRRGAQMSPRRSKQLTVMEVEIQGLKERNDWPLPNVKEPEWPSQSLTFGWLGIRREQAESQLGGHGK